MKRIACIVVLLAVLAAGCQTSIKVDEATAPGVGTAKGVDVDVKVDPKK